MVKQKVRRKTEYFDLCSLPFSDWLTLWEARGQGGLVDVAYMSHSWRLRRTQSRMEGPTVNTQFTSFLCVTEGSSEVGGEKRKGWGARTPAHLVT